MSHARDSSSSVLFPEAYLTKCLYLMLYLFILNVYSAYYVHPNWIGVTFDVFSMLAFHYALLTAAKRRPLHEIRNSRKFLRLFQDMSRIDFADLHRLYLKSLGQNEADERLEGRIQTPRQHDEKSYSMWGLSVSSDQVVAFLLFCDLMFLCIILFIVRQHTSPCLNTLSVLL